MTLLVSTARIPHEGALDCHYTGWQRGPQRRGARRMEIEMVRLLLCLERLSLHRLNQQ